MAMVNKSWGFQILNRGFTVILVVANQVFDGLKNDLAVNDFIGVRHLSLRVDCLCPLPPIDMLLFDLPVVLIYQSLHAVQN